MAPGGGRLRRFRDGGLPDQAVQPRTGRPGGRRNGCGVARRRDPRWSRRPDDRRPSRLPERRSRVARASQGGQGTDGSQGGQGTDGSQGGAANAAATSENWSGYAAAGTPGTPGTFTSVSSSWTEPAVTCSAQQAFSSFWVGLDGDGTQSVEQTGTEADCNNGAASYQGWFEMFPNAPVFYDSPVAPGDTMSASVVANGGGAFTLTLSDQTQGWTQTTDQTSTTAQLGSAEIIAEAPSDTNSALPLSNFGTVNFADAMINNAALTGAGPTELTMVSAAGATEATPSAITNGDDFSVIWDSTGTASSPAATSPPAPARPGP